MSGRLVISRHKSWHVWNQDNKEKVLKDERLNREATLMTEEASRRRAQEHYLELLRANASSVNSTTKGEREQFEKRTDGYATTYVSEASISTNVSSRSDTSTNPDSTLTHFSLFDDPAIASKVKEQNESYVKEKLEKERKESRKAGISAWSSGQLFKDVIPSGETPWYSHPSSAAESSLRFKARPNMSLEMSVDRDNALKEALDPMAALLKHNLIASNSSNIAYTAEDGFSFSNPGGLLPQYDKLDSKSVKLDKKDKNSKKGKKRKREKDKKSAKKTKKKCGDENSSKSSKSSDDEEVDRHMPSVPAIDSSTIEVLRMKRLARESNERERARGIMGSTK